MKMKIHHCCFFSSDLQHVLQTLGEKLSPDETQVRYDAADKDANCDLTFFMEI